MKNKTKCLTEIEYFLSLSEGIIPESKDFLFDQLTKISIEDSIPNDRREDQIYIIMQLYNLLKGIERAGR